MDIVDSQIHLAVSADTATAMMDAVGISAALIDDYWGTNAEGQPLSEATGFAGGMPGYWLNDRLFRPTHPAAELAALKYPSRFSYVVRVEPIDPDMRAIVKMVRQAPHARALRVCAIDATEIQTLADGEYRPLFRAAADENLPVFCFATGPARLWARYFEEFSTVNFILDHCGMPQMAEQFDAVMQLSRHPNVYLKWCHAQRLLVSERFPFKGLFPYVRKAVENFGADRIMWASDYTMEPGSTWAQCLYYLQQESFLSHAEKEWIFSRTARTVLNWPAPVQDYL